jgi:hypothetical protein
MLASEEAGHERSNARFPRLPSGDFAPHRHPEREITAAAKKKSA